MDDILDWFKLPHRTWSPSTQIQIHENPHINWIDIFVLSFYKKEPKGKKIRHFEIDSGWMDG